MQNFFLGDYIKQKRLDLGLTQEQLCDGICEPMTLSRLENGKQTPSRNRINALLQRMGLPDDRYFALLSKNELEMEALQKEIVACNVTERVAEGFEKLAQFEALAAPDDQIAQQFALRSRVLLGRLEGRYTPMEQITLLMQAIRLTVPRFDLENIESFLYTKDEITIINQIGLAYSDDGQNKKAAEIYYQLLRYVRKHFKETITLIGALPLVLYNYARVLDLCGRYEEGAELAQECRKACIQYGHYQELPRCLEIEAECRHFMGDEEISKELYYQSYYLCKVVEYQVGLEIVKKEAKEYLNLTLS
ncbi:MAG: helix-turn-helix domain-containing protein [Faecalibacterium sp.]